MNPFAKHGLITIAYTLAFAAGYFRPPTSLVAASCAVAVLLAYVVGDQNGRKR